MGVAFELIGDELLEQCGSLIPLLQVHHAPHLLELQGAELLVGVDVVGPAGVDLLQHGRGGAGVAQAALDGVFAVEQVLRVTAAAPGLADIHQGVVEVASRHRGVEQIGEGLVGMLLLIEPSVGRIGVVAGGVARPFALELIVQGGEAAAVLEAGDGALGRLDISQGLAVARHLAEDRRLLLDEGVGVGHHGGSMTGHVDGVLSAAGAVEQVAQRHLELGVVGLDAHQLAEHGLLSGEVAVLAVVAVARLVVTGHLALHLGAIGVDLLEAPEQAFGLHLVALLTEEAYLLAPQVVVVGRQFEQFVAVDDGRAVVLGLLLDFQQQLQRLRVAVILTQRADEVVAGAVVLIVVQPVVAQEHVEDGVGLVFAEAFVEHLLAVFPLALVEEAAHQVLVVLLGDVLSGGGDGDSGRHSRGSNCGAAAYSTRRPGGQGGERRKCQPDDEQCAVADGRYDMDDSLSHNHYQLMPPSCAAAPCGLASSACFTPRRSIAFHTALRPVMKL